MGRPEDSDEICLLSSDPSSDGQNLTDSGHSWSFPADIGRPIRLAKDPRVKLINMIVVIGYFGKTLKQSVADEDLSK